MWNIKNRQIYVDLLPTKQDMVVLEGNEMMTANG